MKPNEISNTRANEAFDDLQYIGAMTIWYADVRRAVYYADRPESDVEHSFMLALASVSVAAKLYPHLSQEAIVHFALMHDIQEAITDDIPTLNISDEARAQKEALEDAAVDELVKELPEPWSTVLREYHAQASPEARFVRLMDKVMPPLVNIHGNGFRSLSQMHDVTTIDDLTVVRESIAQRLRQQFPEFPEVHDIRSMVVQRMNEVLFDPETGEFLQTQAPDA